MRPFEGIYFDGRTSMRRAVTAFHDRATLRIVGESVELSYPLALVRVEPPVSGRRHLVRLPDGGQLQTDAAEALEALVPGESASRWLRGAERGWGPSIAAIVFIAATVSWAVFLGIPSAAEWLAKRLPDAAGQEMGRQTMRVLDRGFCKASTYTDERQRDLAIRAFGPLIRGLPNADDFQLQMRACPSFGPNALALPDATVVLTDELVALAENDEEIAAVLAHEVGHVVHRHPLRLALQASGVAMVLSVVASDAFSITALAVALPTLLLESGYSRAFEDAADAFALERLREAGIPRARFGDILERLARAHAARTGDDDGGDYLSTHPASADRIARARAAP